MTSLFAWPAAAGQPPAGGFATLDIRNGHVVVDFDDAVDESVHFGGVVPGSYSNSGNLQIVLIWASTSATSGSVRWLAQVERQQAGGGFDLDSDGFSIPVAAETPAAATAGQLVRSVLDLSSLGASNLPHAGETFRLRVTRDADHAGDILVGDAELVAVLLEEG